MKVNLDKLHKVALDYGEEEIDEREGATFYLSSLVVGAVGLNYPKVVVAVPTYTSRRYIEPMILRNLSMQGFCVSDVKSDMWVIDNDVETRVVFKREDDLDGFSRDDNTAVVFVS